MSKNNSGFYKKKSEWAIVKDELLGCYLTPYLNKIYNTNRPLLMLIVLREKDASMMARMDHLSLRANA